MKFNVKFLAGMSLLFMAAMPVAMNADRAVVVIAKDGTTTETVLPSISRIDIGSGSLTLRQSSGESAEIAYADLDRVLIGAETSAVNELLSDGDIAIWPTLVTGTLNAAGLAEGSVLTVYSSAGSVVASAKADADGNAAIDLSQATSGVYVVATGKQSVKIVKK